MEFRELFDRTPEQIRELTEVWGRSVRATHGFLTEAEIRRIRGYVPHLVATEEKGRYPVFLGASEGMLFLASEERGKGIGRQLLELGILKYGVRELTVNEQNPNAVEFYTAWALSRISGRRPMKKAGRPRFAICGSKKRLPRRGEPPGRLFLWTSCRFAAEGRKKEVSLGGKKGRFRERKGTLREKERFSAAFKNCF